MKTTLEKPHRHIEKADYQKFEDRKIYIFT
jgi:hypothetical protein